MSVMVNFFDKNFSPVGRDRGRICFAFLNEKESWPVNNLDEVHYIGLKLSEIYPNVTKNREDKLREGLDLTLNHWGMNLEQKGINQTVESALEFDYLLCNLRTVPFQRVVNFFSVIRNFFEYNYFHKSYTVFRDELGCPPREAFIWASHYSVTRKFGGLDYLFSPVGVDTHALFISQLLSIRHYNWLLNWEHYYHQLSKRKDHQRYRDLIKWKRPVIHKNKLPRNITFGGRNKFITGYQVINPVNCPSIRKEGRLTTEQMINHINWVRKEARKRKNNGFKLHE